MSAKLAAQKLAAQWTSYEAILPATAGDVQRTETRRAFYAGAQALLAVLAQGISDASEITEADADLMTSVDSELQQFALDVREGRA